MICDLQFLYNTFSVEFRILNPYSQEVFIIQFYLKKFFCIYYGQWGSAIWEFYLNSISIQSNFQVR